MIHHSFNLIDLQFFQAETRSSLLLSLNRIEINFATATCLPARPQETRGEKGDKKGKEKGKEGERTVEQSGVFTRQKSP